VLRTHTGSKSQNELRYRMKMKKKEGKVVQQECTSSTSHEKPTIFVFVKLYINVYIRFYFAIEVFFLFVWPWRSDRRNKYGLRKIGKKVDHCEAPLFLRTRKKKKRERRNLTLCLNNDDGYLATARHEWVQVNWTLWPAFSVVSKKKTLCARYTVHFLSLLSAVTILHWHDSVAHYRVVTFMSHRFHLLPIFTSRIHCPRLLVYFYFIILSHSFDRSRARKIIIIT